MNNDNHLNLHLHDQMLGWLRYCSEQELQNRDKIKVLVQARENLTSASKLNDTSVKGNEIIEYTITISLLI